MTRKVRINVTKRDIELGKPGEGEGCPIALAARRHPELKGCAVGLGLIGTEALGYDSMPLPEEARRFVVDFDDGRPVAPFSFTLEVPEEPS